MWQPGWEGSFRENGYMYMYGWATLLCIWNYQNIVNLLLRSLDVLIQHSPLESASRDPMMSLFFLSGHLNVSHSPELSLLSELAHMNSFSFSFCCILILLNSLSLSLSFSHTLYLSKLRLQGFALFKLLGSSFEKIMAFWDFIFSVSHQIRTLPLIQNYKSMSHIPYLKLFHYL